MFGIDICDRRRIAFYIVSFLDHIDACNRCDIARFMPLHVDEQRVGWFRRDLVPHLEDWPNVFDIDGARVTVSPSLPDPAARSAAIDQVARALAAKGLTNGWRDEPYPAGTRYGENLFTVERAAVPLFGVRAYGVHVNGVVERDDGLYLWVPRRAADRAVAPGKHDNMVAGGQPAGIGLGDNLVKEADEEASIPAALARTAVPVGAISYQMEADHGLKDDVLFTYDLHLPTDFTPVNRDGEVERFELWPVDQVMARVEATDDFKFNVNLVLIDFFIRHGLLTADHPDYVEVATRLRRRS